MTMKYSKTNKILIIIVVLSFCLSLGHSFYFRIKPVVDARAYNQIALNLISGKGYTEDEGVSLQNDTAIVRVGPGYEFFLAGVYKIFGYHVWLIWFLQAIFHALTVLFVYLISKEIFSKNWHQLIGLAAAALVAFSPDLIVASSMLLTENLAVFLLVAYVYFFIRYLNQRTWQNLIIFTLFFAVAVMVRSQLAIMALIFLAAFIVKKEWRKIAVFLLLLAISFAPWLIRNYEVYKTFIPFSAAAGYDLWEGNHSGASGEMEINYQPLIEYMSAHPPLEVNQEGIRQFKEFVFHYPLEFLQITLKRISIFFSFSRPTGFWPSFSQPQKLVTAALSAIYSVLIFTLGLAGIWLSFKEITGQEKSRLKFLLAAAIAIPLGIIFIVVETRYRYPLYPFLAIFGGYAVFSLRQNFSRVISVLASTFLILLANTAIDVFRNLDRIFNYLVK